MKKTYINKLLLIVINFLLINCSTKINQKNFQCDSDLKSAPANIGEIVTFELLVKKIEYDGLHIDFVDGMYANFHILVAESKNLDKWKDWEFLFNFQGQPTINDRNLEVGDIFDFTVKVPQCIGDTWLFLEKSFKRKSNEKTWDSTP